MSLLNASVMCIDWVRGRGEFNAGVAVWYNWLSSGTGKPAYQLSQHHKVDILLILDNTVDLVAPILDHPNLVKTPSFKYPLQNNLENGEVPTENVKSHFNIKV